MFFINHFFHNSAWMKNQRHVEHTSSHWANVLWSNSSMKIFSPIQNSPGDRKILWKIWMSAFVFMDVSVVSWQKDFSFIFLTVCLMPLLTGFLISLSICLIPLLTGFLITLPWCNDVILGKVLLWVFSIGDGPEKFCSSFFFSRFFAEIAVDFAKL